MVRGAALSGVLIAAASGNAMAESFVGRWSIDPAGCTVAGDTAETAPLIATTTSVRWFVADCRIGRMYKIGQAVHVQARCSNEGRIVSTPIKFEPRGDRMRVTWNGVKVREMRRCK